MSVSPARIRLKPGTRPPYITRYLLFGIASKFSYSQPACQHDASARILRIQPAQNY